MKSLAYQTDLAILAHSGRVVDRGAYVVVESPDNPEYFWGNFLIMKSPPQAGDLARWTDSFRREFAHQPLVRHMTFGWDTVRGETGEIGPFLQDGFQLEKSVTLTIEEPALKPPPHPCPDFVIRPILSEEDWEAALKNQVATRLSSFNLETYLPFKRKQMTMYRRLAEAGFGHWFGAFLDGRLVADCGVFVFAGVGRYQSVGTHPDYRRRGICGNLIAATSRFAFAQLGAGHLVMVADPDDHAAKVYESVGFAPTQKQVGIYRFPRGEWLAKS